MTKFKKKDEVIRLEREAVITALKAEIVSTLCALLENPDDSEKFSKFCKRVEYTIRAWHTVHFEDLMQMYAFFDPVTGVDNMKQHRISSEDADAVEMEFLRHLFRVMDKSNFKIANNKEIDIALSEKYLLHLPITVDESKLDKKLLKKYFEENPHENLPDFSDKYVIFRRGIGIDETTDFFFMEKVDILIARFWSYLLKRAGLEKYFGQRKKEPKKDDQIASDDDPDDIYIERISLENMELSFGDFFSKITIQEPTFDRIIVVYRPASKDEDNPDRTIYVKHFRNIPMADLEIVLPEKQNPGLTPTDWVKFLGSAVVGLVAVISSIKFTETDLWVLIAILSTVIGYFSKTYFTFQENLAAYRNLITQSMYDKQLDSGRGTLLHLCDDVIQQEVKEVIISFFALMDQGKATMEELDLRCEELLKEQFDQSCNFDVEDAVQKLEKLGIVSRDSIGRYSCVELRRANEIIGTTTEELVLRARKVM